MSNIADVLEFVQDLSVVSNGDGFDITLSDRQVESMKSTLRKAITTPGSGKPSPVRVTNMRRVLLPVAAELAWPYLAMLVGGGVLVGLLIGKTR